MLSFSYQKHEGRLYPSLSIELAHLDKTIFAEALVDSGADFSLFRADYTDYLGIPLERGKKVVLKGVGGDVVCYGHVLTVRFAGRVFEWQVYFSRQFRFPLNLLGRLSFFEPFDVIFRERTKKLLLADASDNNSG